MYKNNVNIFGKSRASFALTSIMASRASTSALSQTLHAITRIKTTELDKKASAYASKKKEALSHVHGSESVRVGAAKLGNNISKLQLPVLDEKELVNVRTFLAQAAYDPSVPELEITRYQQWLSSNLDHQSHRLEYAKLFSAVLAQHLDASKNPNDDDTPSETSLLDGSFEVLEQDRLRELREKFENVVFNPVDTDEEAIQEYLESLFDTDELKAIINGMQSRLDNDTTAIFEAKDPFNEDVLDWVIRGLLHNDLLTEEQKKLLKSFQADELVRAELCDVLNMRWAELESWSWTDDESGLDVEPRRQLNGKYRVVMREDLLQSMLTHYIGVKLCVNAKEELKYWLERVMVPEQDRGTKSVSQSELDRRQFYLQSKDNVHSNNKLGNRLGKQYWDDIFLSQLPDTVADTGGYDDDADPKEKTGNKKSWLEIKQHLLHHVASEVAIRRKLYDDVAVVQTDLQWFATSVPHSTIFAILEFSGVSGQLLSFIKSYLEVPLNMSKATGEAQEVKKRLRGIPMAHALEKYLGEMILVFLDVAVKRRAGVLLYRMHDDILLCGSTDQCERAWAAMQQFVKIMGLEFNEKKTGSISLGRSGAKNAELPRGDVVMDLLKLSSTDGSWIIDSKQVDAHVKQLKKQLNECTDVLSYVRTYNSCIGRFFGHTFGLPAQCLGHQHVEHILQTHQQMQAELFGDGGVSSVLKTKLKELALEQTDLTRDFSITDSFLYNPILLGGLGTTNPFIPLLLVEPGLRGKTPDERIIDFIELERYTYHACKRAFEQETLPSKKKRRTKIFFEDNSYDEDEVKVSLDEFMSFGEYTRHREWTSIHLSKLYTDLMARPAISTVNLSERVNADLRRLKAAGAKDVDVDKLSSEDMYVLQMFSDEMFKNFGTVGIVDRTLAPLGVMKAVMGEKVTWQMVL